MNAQVKSLAPVLNAPFDDAYASASASVRAMTKLYDGTHYVFAGSRENVASTATFSVRLGSDGHGRGGGSFDTDHERPVHRQLRERRRDSHLPDRLINQRSAEYFITCRTGPAADRDLSACDLGRLSHTQPPAAAGSN